jgi:hypothetical protein
VRLSIYEYKASPLIFPPYFGKVILVSCWENDKYIFMSRDSSNNFMRL